MYMLYSVFQTSESLPPCGGSGLKCVMVNGIFLYTESPSMRREWIEICIYGNWELVRIVSLHAEGVD